MKEMKERIKTLMESQHMTQQVFADYLHINAATLSGIFNDRTNPTLNIVDAVKKKFPDISLEWLMYGSGDMYSSTHAETPSPSSAAPPPTSAPAANQQHQWPQEAVLDFGETNAQGTTPHAHFPTPHNSAATVGNYNGGRNVRPEIVREEVKIIDKPARRVTEIRVYYDDQTWESFVPAKK